MSFFYLSPIRGNLPLHVLEECVENRLKYFLKMRETNQWQYNEFILEGSTYDNLGFFTLKLMSQINEEFHFKHFIECSEAKLFNRRIESLSQYELRKFCKRIYQMLKREEIYDGHYLIALRDVVHKLMIKVIAQHVTCNHEINCLKHFVKIKFNLCLPFIQNRQVDLQNGYAFIPCGLWIDFLKILFTTHLRTRDVKLWHNIKNDPRIMHILKNLDKYKQDLRINPNEQHMLKYCDIDINAKYFPPCMLNLHNTLRKRHRLSHNQRFLYSLFLKDIGLPVGEAITLWRTEYLKQPHGSNTCCHSWGKDEKKYLYSIRHLYGLEGGRKQYSMVNCKYIGANNVNASSEGGCPFNNFDHNILKSILHTKVLANTEVMSDIILLVKRKSCTDACKLYMRSLAPDIHTRKDFYLRPVNFYHQLKELVTKENH